MGENGRAVAFHVFVEADVRAGLGHESNQAPGHALVSRSRRAQLAALWQAPARPVPNGGSGRSDDPLLGRLTQQLTKDQFPVLLE
jgi:hypothetical protein